MPALFAYLLIVGLLLGGGYGALRWLAEPQSLQLVSRQKPKQVPGRQIPLTDNQAASADETNLASSAQNRTGNSTVDSEQATSGVSARQNSDNPAVAIAEEHVRASKDVQPPSEQPLRAAKAEVMRSNAGVGGKSGRDNESARENRPAPVSGQDRSVRTKSASSGNRAVASLTVPKHTKRSYKPPQSSERRHIEIMTLRTIEFPDGRRVTQLLPYQGPVRLYRYDNGANHGERAYSVDGFQYGSTVDADDDW